MVGFGLWCLTPHSTIFQLYRGRQWCIQRKPPTCHRQTLSHVVSNTPHNERLCREIKGHSKQAIVK